VTEPVTAAMLRTAVRQTVRRTVTFDLALGADAFVSRVAQIVGTDHPTPASASAAAARLSLQDLYLAASCAAGDDDAWHEFGRVYRGFMIELARRIVGDGDAIHLVDRLAAELWERHTLARYEGRSTLRTWVGAVVGQAALNPRRPSAPVSGVLPSAPVRDRVADAAAGAAAGRLRTVVGEALAGLAAEDRLLILLHYEQGLSLEQTGILLGASKATLSRQVARARRQLFEAADRLAAAQAGDTARELWRGRDADQLDLELRRACAGAARDTAAGDVSNSAAR